MPTVKRHCRREREDSGVLRALDARRANGAQRCSAFAHGSRPRTRKVNRLRSSTSRVRRSSKTITTTARAASCSTRTWRCPARSRERSQPPTCRRSEYRALFVRSAYGWVPGTLPLARIGMAGPDSESRPTPEVVASAQARRFKLTGALGPRGRVGGACLEPIEVRRDVRQLGRKLAQDARHHDAVRHHQVSGAEVSADVLAAVQGVLDHA